jgi:hypothetical protein
LVYYQQCYVYPDQQKEQSNITLENQNYIISNSLYSELLCWAYSKIEQLLTVTVTHISPIHALVLCYFSSRFSNFCGYSFVLLLLS